MNFRINFLLVCFALVCLGLTARLLYLAQPKAQQQVAKSEVRPLLRQQIVAANGQVLARSVPAYNIYFKPPDKNKKGNKEVKQWEGWDALLTAQVAGLLGVPSALLSKKLRAQRVVLLKRFLAPEKAHQLSALKIKEVLMEKVSQRFYPQKALLAHTLGFAGYNGMGFTGLENYYHTALTQLSSENELIKKEEKLPLRRELVLNIEIELQKKITRLLQQSVKKHQAAAGSILVSELKTGKLIALASEPSFNLNRFTEYQAKDFFNPVTASLLEPGSTLKPFFVAFLLEKGVDPLEKKYYCSGETQLENGEVVHNNKQLGWVSLRDIIQFSCNSGMIAAMQEFSKKELYNFLSRFKINEKTFVDQPGEWRGLLPPVKEWGIRNKATIVIGHGIAMTPLQLLSAFSALINGGKLYTPRIANALKTYLGEKQIKETHYPPAFRGRVLSEETSKQMVELLEYGTVKGSTGYASRQGGLEELFGKTGTSQMVNLKRGGYYTNRYHAIFAGGYPLANPQYGVLVVLKEPKRNYHGGKAAAPLFAEVVNELIKVYRLPNERPRESYSSEAATLLQLKKNGTSLAGRQVPDFSSFSLRRAMVVMQEFKKQQAGQGIKIAFKIEGGGFVVRQSPAPGKILTQDTLIQLRLK